MVLDDLENYAWNVLAEHLKKSRIVWCTKFAPTEILKNCFTVIGKSNVWELMIFEEKNRYSWGHYIVTHELYASMFKHQVPVSFMDNLMEPHRVWIIFHRFVKEKLTENCILLNELMLKSIWVHIQAFSSPLISTSDDFSRRINQWWQSLLLELQKFHPKFKKSGQVRFLV